MQQTPSFDGPNLVWSAGLVPVMALMEKTETRGPVGGWLKLSGYFGASASAGAGAGVKANHMQESWPRAAHLKQSEPLRWRAANQDEMSDRPGPAR